MNASLGNCELDLNMVYGLDVRHDSGDGGVIVFIRPGEYHSSNLHQPSIQVKVRWSFKEGGFSTVIAFSN
jgi:hypothetical protein